MNWKDETRRMVNRSDLTTPEIAEGAGVPIYWLQSFRKDTGPENPGIDNVQKLYDFLSKHKKKAR